MKILLVDDEAEFVSALAERLSFRNIDADWVTRPEDAVPKVEETCYDVAVLDIKMPRVDGIELKKRLQAKCPDLKFIFFTGHGSEEVFKKGASEIGEDYYLLKPIKIDHLIAKLVEIEKQKGGVFDD